MIKTEIKNLKEFYFVTERQNIEVIHVKISLFPRTILNFLCLPNELNQIKIWVHEILEFTFYKVLKKLNEKDSLVRMKNLYPNYLSHILSACLTHTNLITEDGKLIKINKNEYFNKYKRS